MGDKFQSLIRSRRFWAAAGALVVVVAKDQIPILQNFSDEQIQNAILAIGAWIVGESLRSSEKIPVQA